MPRSHLIQLVRATALPLFVLIAGCSNPSNTGIDGGFYAYDVTADLQSLGDSGPPYDAAQPADPQHPPTTSPSEIEAWLATGSYLSWHCESQRHAARPPSPHSDNRICNNDTLWNFNGAGEWPVGSASVKEIYGSGGTTIVGYAMYRHVRAGNTGADWFYYERLPLDSAAPHDANGVVAAGPGNGGPARNICVACHMSAGTDGNTGHDLVFTHVP